MQATEPCPFKVGDLVIYKPSFRNLGLVVMTDLANFKPGEKYTVAAIEENYYVVVEGFESSPGGGLYWTDFAPAS